MALSLMGDVPISNNSQGISVDAHEVHTAATAPLSKCIFQVYYFRWLPAILLSWQNFIERMQCSLKFADSGIVIIDSGFYGCVT